MGEFEMNPEQILNRSHYLLAEARERVVDLTLKTDSDPEMRKLHRTQNGEDAMQDVDEIVSRAADVFELLKLLDDEQRVEAINQIREQLHELSPFADEPVDFVRWVPSDSVYANDYNPNAVAPPEMELLAHSIMADGYTQPIVTYPTDQGREVIDGFHRNRVGKENADVAQRVRGYLPVVTIKQEREDRSDRIAATIRHNRARGKHKVDAMSEIVIELKRRNWSPKKIGKELGMDPDEVLRLCQISGLREMFADSEFSEAWEADHLSDEDFQD